MSDESPDDRRSSLVWDVFISHASEDKRAVATPLAAELRKAGLNVWLDAQELTLGDSLTEKIDDGLANSRFGAVILSEAFFAKDWPKREMNALVGLESARRKVVLPVLHGIGREQIARYSPLLADKLCTSTEKGIQHVAMEIARAVRASEGLAEDEAEHRSRGATESPLLRPELLKGIKIGDYSVGQKVGAGGSGVVFRASHRQLGEQLAIKIFYPLSPEYAHFNSLFERGFRALSRLKHPNIAPTKDFGKALLQGETVFYLVSDYVTGQALDEWTASLGKDREALPKRLRVAQQLATAMQAAHETSYTDEVGFQVHGILHGDVKPSNVIVTSDQAPVLFDFMLVDVQRLLDPRVVPPYLLRDAKAPITGAFGTPGFMAPEQAEHGLVSVSTDIYGLGVTLCYLFLPSHGWPVAMVKADDSLPSAIRDLLIEMTSNEPSARPQSMSEVVKRLGGGSEPGWFAKLMHKSRALFE